MQLFDRSSRTPQFTEAGRALLAQARQVLRQAEVFERTAQSISAGLEPELSISVDSFVPTQPLIRSLAGLQTQHPDLTVTLFTEGLGAAERRVRNGSAILGLCVLLPSTVQELQAAALTQVTLTPVVAPGHPLATETRPITRDILAEHVQLILTDPQQVPGPNFSVVSQRVWRFVDIARAGILARRVWLVHHAATHGGTAPERWPFGAPTHQRPWPSAGIHRPLRNPHRHRPLGLGARWLLANLQLQDWPKSPV